VHRIRILLITTIAVLSTVAAASLAAAAGASLVSAAPSTTGRAPVAHPAAVAKVQLRQTSLGRILVNGRGRTLYMFSRDGSGHDRCATIPSCPGVWPALTSTGTPTAGAGVKAALLGTIVLAHGARQVTYAGHPLYTYLGDSAPGETSYVGVRQFGGRWYALSSGGGRVS
jgi:predicted lipoprotein with Yx(FWY)xxD motif